MQVSVKLDADFLFTILDAKLSKLDAVSVKLARPLNIVPFWRFGVLLQRRFLIAQLLFSSVAYFTHWVRSQHGAGAVRLKNDRRT